MRGEQVDLTAWVILVAGIHTEILARGGGGGGGGGEFSVISPLKKKEGKKGGGCFTFTVHDS